MIISTIVLVLSIDPIMTMLNHEMISSLRKEAQRYASVLGYVAEAETFALLGEMAIPHVRGKVLAAILENG